MNYPRWRQSLARSLHLQRGKPEAKFFQLANIDEKGRAKNRTVVFRGFAENNNAILAITDIRSEKYTQLIASPHVQICWYFTETREQFRISCEVNLLTIKHKDKQRVALWSMLSNSAKKQFSWPAPMQLVSAASHEQNVTSDIETFDANNTEPHENFVVLIFTPLEVDYLNLSTTPQTRELHLLDTDTMQWTDQTINP